MSEGGCLKSKKLSMLSGIERFPRKDYKPSESERDFARKIAGHVRLLSGRSI